MDTTDIKRNLKGNIVPVPAQFNRDLSLNYEAYQEHIAFLVSKEVKNFYLAQSASEFDYMTLDERVSVTNAVASALPGDCLLIAQAVGGHWIDEQIREAKMLMDNGVHAVVVAPRGIKEGNKFFSSFYKQGFYAPDRHDDYYVSYMEKFASETNAPIVYHDKPFKSGKGPSIEMLSMILDIEDVVGLKEHVYDPLTLYKVYQKFGNKVACFDGFGKTVQFWSLQWGAQARHTCWSWFDPDLDMRFTKCMQNGDLSEAVRIINSEWPVAEAICTTGFQGYKYIMELMGLPAGPVRIPGEELTEAKKRLIEESMIQIGLLD